MDEAPALPGRWFRSSTSLMAGPRWATDDRPNQVVEGGSRPRSLTPQQRADGSRLHAA